MDESHVADRDFILERDEAERLVLVDATGERHVGGQAIRAFPVSDPQGAVSICDHAGRELVYVADLADVPAAMRELLELELSRREFVPIIQRILNTPPETEPAEWRVETDRGLTVFQLESESDVHRTGARQVILVDAHGIRYLIPDVSQLDAHSRRVLDRFL
jgi:hypothetical protein